MAWIDSWGNEYKTKVAAKKGIRKIFKNSPDFWPTVAKEMGIPEEVMDWINDPDRIQDFKFDFQDEIEEITKDWCSWYYDDLERIEE